MVTFPENQQFRYIDKELTLAADTSDTLVTEQLTTADGTQTGLFTLNFNEGDISLSSLAGTSSGLQADPEMIPVERAPAPDMTPLELPPCSMSPMKALPPPPPPPVRLTRTEEPPSRAMSEAAHPALDPRVTDEAYEGAMTTLVQAIHKSNGEWGKKSRELTLLCTKLKSNAMTRDSEVLKNLQDLMNDAKKYDAYTQSIEEKFALAQFVDSHEQSLAKKRIAQVQGITKECAKIKLQMPSINYGKRIRSMRYMCFRNPPLFAPKLVGPKHHQLVLSLVPHPPMQNT